MDDSETPLSANSKVIIQCTDPNDLFDRIEPRLSSRSPLRNLHWKAPNRPLRSIRNLNLSLTREDKSVGAQSTVRRHQIPGLRETPYVKVYLVRCDDKETYKERVRKEIRQWVKSQAPIGDSKSSGKTQEGHDASEWLILHVVLPNTPAASQSKSSKHISVEASESTDSVNSKSKWPGKGSSTIFDKLRADFSSFKSSLARVSQVRLLEPGDRSSALTPAESEEQWQDLVDNLKSCILRSFDARVAQYESDIRERDSQSHLPGWNFCTFFVLKEGLAKGFENLGLLEDALAVYDELSLGLDALITEQAGKDDNDDGGALLAFSKESKAFLRAALDSETQAVHSDAPDLSLDLQHIVNQDRDYFPFDLERKNYRSLILSNEVSALDLRIYLFTRETEIMTRQARADPIKSSQSKQPSVNPAIFANLVERATTFISLTSRNLRLELYHAWGGQEGLSQDELLNQRTVVGNIVSTWRWRAAMQILAQAIPELKPHVDIHADVLSLGALELSERPDTDLGSLSYEDGAAFHRMSLGPDVPPSSRERSQERNKRHSIMPNGTISRHSMTAHPGYRNLALWVSKLVLMARHTLEDLDASRPLVARMHRLVLDSTHHNTESVALNGETGYAKGGHQSNQELLSGLGSAALLAAASSEQYFTNLYLLLSVFAYRAVSGTGNPATSRQIVTNLVEMEYTQGNHALAARYLRSLLGPLPHLSYQPGEGPLLYVYAKCLKELERPSEYARCLISCLHHARQAHMTNTQPSPSTLSQHCVDQLFHVLPRIPPMTLPASSLFHVSAVSRTISPFDSKDGFAVSLSMNCMSGAGTLPLLDIKLRLVAKDSSEPRFIVLSLHGEVAITVTGTTVSLETPVTTQGWYVPDEVELSVGNLRLLHHFKTSDEDDLAWAENVMSSRPAVLPLLVYPSYRTLAVKIYPFPVLHLAEIRRLLLQVRPGQNNVKQCKLRIRTATAGLRLNIHDSKLVGLAGRTIRLSTAREGDALLMILDNLIPESITDIEIPYTMEIASEPAVALRVEATYETEQGTFTLHDILVVKVILPVTVNVQDVFRKDCMYSKFTISPSTMVPLRLIGCRLEENVPFEVTTGGSFDEPIVVFPKQPANWTIRLTPQRSGIESRPRRMTLIVDFQSLDGVIFAILETHFTREIMGTEYAFAARLLGAHLVERVRTTWTEQDVEVAGLLQEFEVWKMEDMGWHLVLCAFDKDTRAGIERWLGEWHARTPRIMFSSSKVPQRQLKLFVDVPPWPLLITAFLDVKMSMPADRTATIGQPIAAEFVVRLGDHVKQELEGSFKLNAPSDSWLIVGRRKGNLSLTEQPSSMQIVLLPQQLGHLLLPTVNLRCRKRVQSGSHEEWVEVLSELYNPAQGRSILVTPDLRSTTVEVFGAIPDEGTGRLITSENRGGVG